MYKVTHKGISYRCRKNPEKDTVFILPYTFVIDGIISEREWAKSRTKLVDRFNITMSFDRVDGRNKDIANLPYFSWSKIIT